eukprot:6348075-Alexandrium_andersonii.AAC.1
MASGRPNWPAPAPSTFGGCRADAERNLTMRRQDERGRVAQGVEGTPSRDGGSLLRRRRAEGLAQPREARAAS